MTNTPSLKTVTKEFLVNHFDANEWEARLNKLTPRETDYGPTPPEMGCPKGTMSFVYLYKDQNGIDIALVTVLRTPDNKYCGSRKFHPTALLIDGAWCIC